MLETIASDPGLQQSALVLLGLFGRACRVLGKYIRLISTGQSPTVLKLVWITVEDGGNEDSADATEEISNLVKLLESRHLGIARTLDAEFPELRATIWQSEGTVQAAVQSLTPQMTENRKKVMDTIKKKESSIRAPIPS